MLFVDYGEVYAPLVRYTTLFNENVSDDIYLEFSSSVRFNQNKERCFSLLRLLYCLKEAACVWHEELEKCLPQMRFQGLTQKLIYFLRENIKFFSLLT